MITLNLAQFQIPKRKVKRQMSQFCSEKITLNKKEIFKTLFLHVDLYVWSCLVGFVSGFVSKQANTFD